MGNAFRPVRKNQLHITLKFLGETPSQSVPEIAAAIGEIVSGRSLFQMNLEGVGVFPHLRRPTVFWVGVHNEKTLVSLANELENRLEPLGFPREQREFSPHLTVARIRKKPPDELFELLEKARDRAFGTVRVDRLILMQSQLSYDGPEYLPLATFPLE